MSLVWGGQEAGPMVEGPGRSSSSVILAIRGAGRRCKNESWVGQGFGHSPTPPTGHSSFFSAVIRGVTTKELYPEFGLDMND